MPQGGAEPSSSVADLAREAMRRGLEALAAAAAGAPKPEAASALGRDATEPIPLGAPALAATASASATMGHSMASGLRWLERAHRLVPHDPNATLTLASACLAQDPARAAMLFRQIADQYDTRQAWLGLAAARLRLAGPDDAAEPLAVVLSRYAFTSDAAALADAIGCRSGGPGWCALRSDGRLEIHPPPTATGPVVVRPVLVRPLLVQPVLVQLDGKPLDRTTLPAGWEQRRLIDLRIGDVPLLGSPIRIGAIRRLAGCVEVRDGCIHGWAWHPGDPGTSPALTVLDRSRRPVRHFTADDETVAVGDTGPLARPRSFRLTPAELPDAPGPVHIIGPDGKDLPGSPLDPFAEEAEDIAAALLLGRRHDAGPEPSARRSRGAAAIDRSAAIAPPLAIALPAATAPPAVFAPTAAIVPSAAIAGAATQAAAATAWTQARAVLRADRPVPAQPIGADGHKRATTVVVPVHEGGAVVQACLDSVLASLPEGARVLVVDDGSTDPALIAALDDRVRRRQIALLRHKRAQGFPAAANAGIRAARGRDVVLLNSDTLVPPGWLERLREAAYADRAIGTVTPLSNDASILSYPGPAGTNPRPDQAATNRLDRAAARANGGTVIDIPVGVGFCLYLRRDCLNAVGCFRPDLFAQGYGEENDLCLRARRLGWRNVALTGLFVGHVGSASFRDTATHLRARNSRILEQQHPGYAALVADYLAHDPLAESRRRIDLQRWRARGRVWRRSAILITHHAGGGVEQRLIHAIRSHVSAGRRAIVLRPGKTSGGETAVRVGDGAAASILDGTAADIGDGPGADLPNLVFALPRELPALLRLLRAAKPKMIEAHHFAEHSATIYDLVAQLGVPCDVHIHDYAWFCPRVSLVGAHDRYCGEPDLPDCEACVADNGHFLHEDITVADLRRRSASFLAAARRVVVPSDDTGIRMRRHFDGLTTVTVPHEDDRAISLPPARPAIARDAHGRAPAGRSRAAVCVVGAIGVHKGYDILLACARDAARRDLDLEFVVVGHTIDDARMLATGRVFVTGRFDPDEAVGLIAAQKNARLGFIASICPETWCLSLGDIWRAGLPAAAFDIGAPAERIRQTGRGILLPLGLSASAINNALITAMWTAPH
jgi:GT2 family glycosyltransferase